MTVFVTADVPAYECADLPLDRLWRESVGKDDLVYVIVGETAHWVLPQIDALPGRKRLVTGIEAVEGGFLLSPLPLHPSQLGPGEINLHGRPARPLAPGPRRLCVSVERTGFRPVRLSDARLLAERAQLNRLDLVWSASETLEAAE
jgi:hypothetical protein